HCFLPLTVNLMDADTTHGQHEGGKPPSPMAESDRQQDNAPALRKRLLAARAALSVTQQQEAAAKIMRHLQEGWQDSPAGKLLTRLDGAKSWPNFEEEGAAVQIRQPGEQAKLPHGCLTPPARKPVVAAF